MENNLAFLSILGFQQLIFIFINVKPLVAMKIKASGIGEEELRERSPFPLE